MPSCSIIWRYPDASPVCPRSSLLPRRSGAVYTAGSLPTDVWDRYLAHFDSVRVIGRDGGLLPTGANFARTSCPDVTFDLVPVQGYAQLILGPTHIREQVRAGVEACDAAIVRLPSELGFMAAAECRKIGKPYAVEVVGCAWDGMRNHGSWFGRVYAPLFYQRTRRALSRAPLALYVTTNWLQQRYPTTGKSYGASDVEIAPMGSAELQARKTRLQRIAGGDLPELGTVASLRIRSKGIQTALAALEMLRKERLSLRYRSLGPAIRHPGSLWPNSMALRTGFVRRGASGGRRGSRLARQHRHPPAAEFPGRIAASDRRSHEPRRCVHWFNLRRNPELLPPERLHEPGDVAALAQRIKSLATNARTLAEASDRDLQMSRAFEPQRLAAIRSEFLAGVRSAAERAPKRNHVHRGIT